MSINIPTTQEIKETNITNYENQLGQSAPINKKAFLNVDSAIQALQFTQLYKFGIERSLQNLALTATGDDLEKIGNEYGVNRAQPTSAQLTAELPAADGTIISPIRTFVSVLTGIRYTLDAQSVAAGGVAVLNLTAETQGEDGNLEPPAQLTIDSPVSGAEQIATVTILNAQGVNQEDIEDYRSRVLAEIRRAGGGGNSSDYRSWAQEVAGVKKAYPFSGKPVSILAESSPPDRTVYIEATDDIDPDGIAPQSLLDAVRANITLNPETGRERQPMGLTDETLFIESITRSGFYVSVRNLNVPDNQVANAQSALDNALDVYFRSLESFVEGLDPTFEKNDFVTDVTISGIVDDVLRSFGGTADGVGFGVSPGNFLSSYNLAPGELGKLIQVDYE